MKLWQPIETAPKDTEVILFQNGRVTWGEWDHNFGKDGGWIWWGDVENEHKYDDPTHWQPAPEQP